MRDDFNIAAKELLAKRVGFRCSNPGCRQPTSGPQADPSGSVNIGIAAHVTAASPDGPRYDPSLSTDQRSAPENGVWLCQSCAKLVDNDISKYGVEVLQDWKTRAEATAARDLEQRLRRYPDRASSLERMERIMPALLSEMRQDLAAYPLFREVVLLMRGWTYMPGSNQLCYYFDDHSDLDSKFRILENEGLVREITYNSVKRYIMSEWLAEYLGAP